MDPITSVALPVILMTIWFYVLYTIIRKAVAGGIRDARDSANRDADQ